VPDKLDHHKLLNAVDFVQGFIRPVTVVYEETIEREAAVVNGRPGLHGILQPVYVRVENRNNWINVMVVLPGGGTDVKLTEYACKLATEHFQRG